MRKIEMQREATDPGSSQEVAVLTSPPLCSLVPGSTGQRSQCGLVLRLLNVQIRAWNQRGQR